MTLHGKFRHYRVDTASGDSLTHYSLGNVGPDGETGSTLLPLPEGVVREGIERPTYWSRLPLSIQPNNRDQRRGLYSIHAMGTSLIFPLSQKDKEVWQECNMRCCTAGVYLAIQTDSPSITFYFRYLHRGNPASDGRPALKGLDHRSFSGIDIYQLVEGKPVFRKNLRSASGVMEGSWTYETGLVPGAGDSQLGKFIIMLPTYNGFQPVAGGENPSGLTLEFHKKAIVQEFQPFQESSRPPSRWLGQGLTEANLHPPVEGMTSIANFVLEAIARAELAVYDGTRIAVPEKE